MPTANRDPGRGFHCNLGSGTPAGPIRGIICALCSWIQYRLRTRSLFLGAMCICSCRTVRVNGFGQTLTHDAMRMSLILLWLGDSRAALM